jgi:hypothetical protein
VDIHPENMNIANEKKDLKRRLRAVGMSYRRMAPVLGVHYVYLCEILNGRRDNSGIGLCTRLDAQLKKMETQQAATPARALQRAAKGGAR